MSPYTIGHREGPSLMRMNVGLRVKIRLLAPSMALAYFVLLGGTPIGEQLGILRLVNTALGAGLVIIYVRRAPGRSDRLDHLLLAALVLMAVSALFSVVPRQSLDALMAMVTFTAVVFVARDAMANAALRRSMVWTLRLLAAGIVVFVGLRYLPEYVEWIRLSDPGLVPPLGLPFVARPWGNAYDLTTLAIMLVPSWLVGRLGRAEAVVLAALASILGLVVFLLGSRAQWLAIVAASVLIGTFPVIGALRGRRPQPLVVAVVSVGVLVMGVVFGGPALDRMLASATVDQRAEMWTAAIRAWFDRPIVGFGPGSFPWVLQQTTYFDTNSLHPRHPDSALFQLLPEAGLLGMTAAAAVVGGTVAKLARARAYLALWPIAFLLIEALGGNPTDFGYLIIVAALWVAIGVPRASQSDVAPERTVLRPVFAAGGAVLAVPLAAMLAAGLAFDAGASAVHGQRVDEARADFGVAIALDPGMALYARQRGIANLLGGRTADAVSDLRRATVMNPSDDLSWRALAIGLRADGQQQEASNALDRALDVQRSDKSSQLLRAAWQAEDGDVAALGETLGELVLAWPTVVAAPGWDVISAGLISPREAIALALDRWERGEPSPEPLRGQLFTLAILGERPDLLDDGAAVAQMPHALADAAVGVGWCTPAADELLASVPPDERRISTFWMLRVQQAAERGEADPSAMGLYRLMTVTDPSMESATHLLNPLRENNDRGDVDTWGYDRVVVRWEASPILLPSPDAGADRLIVDPLGAREAMGFSSGPGNC